MPIVNGDLVPTAPGDPVASPPPASASPSASASAPESSPSPPPSRSCCVWAARWLRDAYLGPRVPFLRCDVPVILLVLAWICVGLYYSWSVRPLLLFFLQATTISLLSFIPRREGYTYDGDQGPSTSSRPRQMSVRDLPDAKGRRGGALPGGQGGG